MFQLPLFVSFPMTEKEQYRQLCDTHSDVPLFLQHWWLETVCEGKQWDVLLYRNGEGVVQAAMPFLIGKRLGFKYIVQPQLTQYNGVWYFRTNFKNENERLSFEKKACQYFIDKIKCLGISYFNQNFPTAFTNWLPFYWNGYRQTTRYTYQIPDISDLDAVFAAMDKKRHQSKILALQDKYRVAFDLTPEVFYDFHARYWHGRGGEEMLPRKFVIDLCNAALARGQGLLAGLYDADNCLVAAYFVAYDSTTAYALMSAFDKQKNENGMTALLVWNIIKKMTGRVQTFDFEGSMDENVEYSFRYYGTKQVPYFQIVKSNSRIFDLLLWLKKHFG